MIVTNPKTRKTDTPYEMAKRKTVIFTEYSRITQTILLNIRR